MGGRGGSGGGGGGRGGGGGGGAAAEPQASAEISGPVGRWLQTAVTTDEGAQFRDLRVTPAAGGLFRVDGPVSQLRSASDVMDWYGGNPGDRGPSFRFPRGTNSRSMYAASGRLIGGIREAEGGRREGPGRR
jgi:hypothetical protein